MMPKTQECWHCGADVPPRPKTWLVVCHPCPACGLCAWCADSNGDGTGETHTVTAAESAEMVSRAERFDRDMERLRP